MKIARYTAGGAAARRESRPFLSLPGVRREALLGALAQLSQGAAGIGIVLVVRQATGSFAEAGVATAAFAIGAGVGRPPQGRLIDQRGPAPVLAVSALLHAAGLIGLALAAALDAPLPAYACFAAVCGLALPAISASMRISWAAMIESDRRTAAFGLVTVTQETALLAGPLLLGALVAAVSAPLALAVVAALSAIATALFAAILRDRQPDRAASSGLGGPLAGAPVRALLSIVVVFAASIGAIEVAAPALATSHHAPAASGALIAAMSVGGILGGIAYSASRHQGAPASLVALLAAMALAIAALLFVHGLVAAGALLLLVGAAVNPTITTAALLLDDHAHGSRGEVFGWLSTAVALGAAAGNAITGLVAQSHGSSRAFLVAALAAALASVWTLAVRRTLSPPDR